MKLTKAEKALVAEVQKALDKCPSTRLGFATTGDHDLTIFDIRGIDKICARLDRGTCDFIPTADKLGLVAAERLSFPQPVESTAG
jgi:hypothetical protein